MPSEQFVIVFLNSRIFDDLLLTTIPVPQSSIIHLFTTMFRLLLIITPVELPEPSIVYPLQSSVMPLSMNVTAPPLAVVVSVQVLVLRYYHPNYQR